MEGKEENKPESKPSYIKTFWWGFLTAVILFIAGLIWYSHEKSKSDQARAIIEKSNETYRLKHRQDSLIMVHQQIAKYEKIRRSLALYDSAQAKLRFKIGEIVYLKPDSNRGVINEISNLTTDSTIYDFLYHVIIVNKEGKPEIWERRENLIY